MSPDLFKDNDNDKKAIEIFASSELTTVYLDGLSNEDFFEMLSKMFSILLKFSSQGSGRILRKINRLEIKIAIFVTVHAWSNISLPGFLNDFLPLIAQHTKPF